jgi:spermidine synthase
MLAMNARHLLYILFTISGFAGLIYESIWSHYLKLILGHAAYAQTLVLSLFMGGMALGAWLCGRLSERIRRPLLGYAMVEVALGTFALLFDPLFRWVSSLLLEQLAPSLGSPVLVDLAKWSVASLLILPPCILLGATFPLISAGVYRIDPKLAGRTLGWLYFTNSIGAVAGVLTSGLFLIKTVGLPGTLMTAGLLNFFLALGVWLIGRSRADDRAVSAPAASSANPLATPTLLLAVTFGSSAASFCYEIGWIRMLSLVMGSATHSFELMLAAFILGLALGALFIRNRIDSLKRPLLVLAVVQILMGVFALSTLALYEQSFGWMASILKALTSTDEGYTWYLISSAGISMAIMLPATICAGMTLPLITAWLLHGGYGESSIGRVYAANTLGAIFGILLAVHVLMPILGVRQAIAIGGVIDVGIGLWLWQRAGATSLRMKLALGGALACGLVFLTWKPFDQSLLSSGVFREGAVSDVREVLFHQDGKTATVHVYADAHKRLLIATNGKVDAALDASTPTVDDYTMILLGALPLSMHPEAQDIAVIGFGSGRSTHTFLQVPQVRRVESIEIEPAIVAGARAFGPLVASAYNDPRSQIHIEDAKTFFARSNRQYDIIASEPSNPWVSGVSSLFTREFYHQVKQYLKPETGLFVQWLQAYESDISLLTSVIGALDAEFADYAIYFSNDYDLVIVASADGKVPPPGRQIFAAPSMAKLLAGIDVHSVDALTMRYLGGPGTVGKWLATKPFPANSDYFPYVDQHAAQARFRQSSVRELHEVLPYAYRLAGGALADTLLKDDSRTPSLAHALEARKVATTAAWFSDAAAVPVDAALNASTIGTATTLLSIRQHCLGPDVQIIWLPALQRFLGQHALYLRPTDAAMLATQLRENDCHPQLKRYVAKWLDFMEAIARQDHAATRRLGSELIAEEIQDGHPLQAGLVYPVLLSDLMAEGPQALLARATELKQRLPRGAALDFLLAQTLERPTAR